MTKELINEAREFLASENAQYYDSSLVRSLVDALEAATRVPVQGEPNDDRELIAAILQWRHPGNMYSTCERDADAILAAGFSRATVPDAATEELRPDEMTAKEATELVLKRPGMYGLVPKTEHRSMKAERDAAVAAIERVRANHQPDPYDASGKYCTCEEAWPCSTIAALDGAPEPEVKP